MSSLRLYLRSHCLGELKPHAARACLGLRWSVQQPNSQSQLLATHTPPAFQTSLHAQLLAMA